MKQFLVFLDNHTTLSVLLFFIVSFIIVALLWIGVSFLPGANLR